MSAASFVTSVQVIHIHTQMSAALIDGASLTPSHVIATTFHAFLRMLTISCLSEGLTLAITHTFFSNSDLFFEFSKSSHVIISHSIHSSFAIAHAVTKLSHVIIITRIPAFCSASTKGCTKSFLSSEACEMNTSYMASFSASSGLLLLLISSYNCSTCGE